MSGIDGADALPRILAVENDLGILRCWTLALSDVATVVPAPSFSAARSRTERELWMADSFRFVFVDSHLPDGDVFDLLPRIAGLSPRPQVAVLASRLDAELAVRLHGACTIAAPKSTDRDALMGILSILRAAADRESTLNRFARCHHLSPQETRLLSLAVQEMPNKQTAGELGCSECTVRTYWHRVFAKVGCASQRDVVARLFRFGQASQLSVTK